MHPKNIRMMPKYFFLSLSFSRIKLAKIKIPTNKIIFDNVKYFISNSILLIYVFYFMSNNCKSLFIFDYTVFIFACKIKPPKEFFWG